MSETRRKHDAEFREGAVRIVRETGKPIAQVARDLGVDEGALGNSLAKDREQREGATGLSTGDLAKLKRLRVEVAELRTRIKRGVTAVALVSSIGLLAAGCNSGDSASTGAPPANTTTSAAPTHNSQPGNTSPLETSAPVTTAPESSPSTDPTSDGFKSGAVSAARGEALVENVKDLCTYDQLVKQMRDYIKSKPYCAPIGQTKTDYFVGDGTVFGFKPNPDVNQSDGVLAAIEVDYIFPEDVLIPEGATKVGEIDGATCYDGILLSNGSGGQYNPGKTLECEDSGRKLQYMVAMGQDGISESLDERKSVMKTVIDWVNQSY